MPEPHLESEDTREVYRIVYGQDDDPGRKEGLIYDWGEFAELEANGVTYKALIDAEGEWDGFIYQCVPAELEECEFPELEDDEEEEEEEEQGSSAT